MYWVANWKFSANKINDFYGLRMNNHFAETGLQAPWIGKESQEYQMKG